MILAVGVEAWTFMENLHILDQCLPTPLAQQLPRPAVWDWDFFVARRSAWSFFRPEILQTYDRFPEGYELVVIFRSVPQAPLTLIRALNIQSAIALTFLSGATVCCERISAGADVQMYHVLAHAKAAALDRGLLESLHQPVRVWLEGFVFELPPETVLWTRSVGKRPKKNPEKTPNVAAGHSTMPERRAIARKFDIVKPKALPHRMERLYMNDRAALQRIGGQLSAQCCPLVL